MIATAMKSLGNSIFALVPQPSCDKRCAAAAVQHNAHDLRTPKHGGRYRMDGGMAGKTC